MVLASKMHHSSYDCGASGVAESGSNILGSPPCPDDKGGSLLGSIYPKYWKLPID